MNTSTLKRSGTAVIVWSLILLLTVYPLYAVFGEEIISTDTPSMLAATTPSAQTPDNAVTATTSSPAAGNGTNGATSTTTEISTSTTPLFSSTSGDTTSPSTTTTPEATTTISSSTSPEYEYTGTTTPATSTTATGTDATSTTGGGTSITTGNAVALANVLNLVNSNFINSSGVVVFKNFFDVLLDNFDLRDFYNSLLSPLCSLTGCSQKSVETNLTNTASTTNDIHVQAISGGNQIVDSGSSTITTGNAYAGVNLINVANTNVVDSNYLLVSMNAFADVNGDIVFPSLSHFFGSLDSGAPLSSATIANTSDVTNNVSLDADSGGNSASSTGTSTITTGESAAKGNVFNQLNSSLIGGQNISLLFRVQGNWAGQIFNAPDNIGWMEDGKGGLYLFDKTGMGGTHASTSSLSVHATNTASIHNNLNVLALTGTNAISGGSSATISTGKAYAGVNIINVANATIVGRNWIMAILNIFGNFNGNISFGQPDLFVAGQVDTTGKITDGSDLKYKITIINNGDAPSSQVVLRDRYDTAHLDIHDSSAAFTTNADGGIEWKLPKLAPGQSAAISYSGRVKNAGYSTDITSTLDVTGHETDHNRKDNTDILTVTTEAARSGGRSGGIHLDLASEHNSTAAAVASTSAAMLRDIFKVERLVATSTIDTKAGKTTEYIKLTNASDATLHDVVFRDLLKDPEGMIISDELWRLGDVQPREEIDISYEINFKPTALPGRYVLESRAETTGGKEIIFPQNGTIMLTAHMSLVPLALSHPAFSTGMVLGATASASSAPTQTTKQIKNMWGANVAEASDGKTPAVPFNAATAENFTVLFAALLAAVVVQQLFSRV